MAGGNVTGSELGTGSELTLTSPAFAEGDEIPRKFTCEGENVSPALAISPPPPGTKSMVLVVDDPDAPDPAMPKMRWVHWVLYNLPPETRHLPEGVRAAELPPGTVGGLNDRKKAGYGGPCPPIGQHRYFFAIYALDTVLPIRGALTRDQVLKPLEGHVLAQAELVGTYQKVRGH